MIIYDLKCEENHTFEGWFKDRAAFEEQCEKKLITCPVCGSSNVHMVLSSISVMGRDARQSDMEFPRELSPAKALQIVHEYVDKTFEDVGDRFAEVALNIHHGKEDKRNIRGVTTREEEKTLRDEGVKFIKIPVPKFDS